MARGTGVDYYVGSGVSALQTYLRSRASGEGMGSGEEGETGRGGVSGEEGRVERTCGRWARGCVGMHWSPLNTF